VAIEGEHVKKPDVEVLGWRGYMNAHSLLLFNENPDFILL
jgi:hypothetical protein